MTTGAKISPVNGLAFMVALHSEASFAALDLSGSSVFPTKDNLVIE